MYYNDYNDISGIAEILDEQTGSSVRGENHTQPVFLQDDTCPTGLTACDASREECPEEGVWPEIYTIDGARCYTAETVAFKRSMRSNDTERSVHAIRSLVENVGKMQRMLVDITNAENTTGGDDEVLIKNIQKIDENYVNPKYTKFSENSKLLVKNIDDVSTIRTTTWRDFFNDMLGNIYFKGLILTVILTGLAKVLNIQGADQVNFDNILYVIKYLYSILEYSGGYFKNTIIGLIEKITNYLFSTDATVFSNFSPVMDFSTAESFFGGLGPNMSPNNFISPPLTSPVPSFFGGGSDMGSDMDEGEYYERLMELMDSDTEGSEGAYESEGDY